MKRVKSYLNLFHIQSISKTVSRNQRIFFFPPMVTMIISGKTCYSQLLQLNDILVSKPKMSQTDFYGFRVPLMRLHVDSSTSLCYISQFSGYWAKSREFSYKWFLKIIKLSISAQYICELSSILVILTSCQ